MIAGFEEPTGGQVLLDGVDVSSIPAHQRPVNTVFQNYALFPFMSVSENVGFGLKYEKLSKQEMAQRVGQALELVRMGEYAKRKPSQLSGGQQQRVALARALVLGPRVLLLDEPLGALDAKLRKTLQVELKALQQSVGITFVYVTHDQEEALTMSDRIAVMANGLVEQIGTPAQVYEQPDTAYVADFLGSANIIDVTCLGPSSSGGSTFKLGDVVLEAGGAPHAAGNAKLVVRPERLNLEPAAAVPPARSIRGTVERVVYLGGNSDVAVSLPGGAEIVVNRPSEVARVFGAGDCVDVIAEPDALRLLPPGALALSNSTDDATD
jgi:spermidine/putrescine transport system ATP-binding protein